MLLLSSLRATSRLPALQMVKVALATTAAWFIGSLLIPGQLPVFGAVAALLVVQPSVNQSVGKAIERSLGVIVGVLVAYGVALVFGTSSWIVLLAIVVAIVSAWVLRLPQGTSNQVPISAMLVLSIGARTPDYALDRIAETIIGAAVGVVVNLAIVPPVLLAPAHDAVLRLLSEIAATMERLASLLAAPPDATALGELLVTARLLRPMHEKAQAAMVAAEESLAFNPRGATRREELERDAALLTLAGPLVTQVIGMTRALRDHDDPSVRREPMMQQIVEELRRAAHDLRLRMREHTEEGAVTGPPALTAPLTIAAPDPTHWVLLGSLLEDLRRVHETIAGD